MKTFMTAGAIVAALAFLIPNAAFARSHSECACQVSNHGADANKSTNACCGQFGASLVNYLNGEAPGLYCQTAGDEIDGDDFQSCCQSNGASTSTCIS